MLCRDEWVRRKIYHSLECNHLRNINKPGTSVMLCGMTGCQEYENQAVLVNLPQHRSLTGGKFSKTFPQWLHWVTKQCSGWWGEWRQPLSSATRNLHEGVYTFSTRNEFLLQYMKDGHCYWKLKQWYLNLWLGRRNAEACSNFFLSWLPTIRKYYQFMGLNVVSWGMNCHRSIPGDIDK